MAEIFAEMLGGTETSPLYTKLVKESGAFNAAESFCMRSSDDSIFMIYGILNQGVSHEEGEKQLLRLLQDYSQPGAFEADIFNGVQNRAKAHMLYDRVSVLTRAQKFCFYELMGDVAEIELEADRYLEFSEADALNYAAATFKPETASVLHYSPIA